MNTPDEMRHPAAGPEPPHTRREWLLFAAGICRAALPAMARDFESFPPGQSSRLYEVHACVTLLGATMLTRKRVGSACASVQSSPGELLLEFAAGSDPERAAGVNRVGLIEELLSSKSGGAVETSYFGLMTASPEESLSDARKALRDSPAAQIFLAAEGRSQGGRITSATHRIQFGEPFTWSRRGRLLAIAKQAAASRRFLVRDNDFAARPGVNAGALSTLLSAFESPEPKTRSAFTYNSASFELTTERIDPRSRNGPPDSRINGQIKNLATGRKSVFRVWIGAEGSSPVPVRIEYQAKPYLRLIFEQVDPQGVRS
jgi:hypothetical protein